MMTDREKMICAIERAKRQSEEYAQDRIFVPFKEADMIVSLLKEQEPVRWVKISPAGIYECSGCGQNVMTGDIEAYRYCHGCGRKVKWND